jgi:hypothetical protein
VETEIHSAVLDEYARRLGYGLANCDILPDGTIREQRQLVDRCEGVKIVVYSADHMPPHFHVKCGSGQACFRIDSCERLRGDLAARDERIIRFWHGFHKAKLVEVWEKTRPGTVSFGAS